MNRTRKAFAALAAAALIVPAAAVTALTGPASADADGKHRHDLDTYKREAWVEILGTPAGTMSHTIMSCDPGDYALDGMWKVDAHDGDDRTVRATVSRRNYPSDIQWEFKLVNDGPGRAQVKTFVTCLDATTGERDGHHHDVVAGTLGEGISNTAIPAAGVVHMSATCAVGHIPVAPSFALGGGSDARLLKSYPDAALTGWEWTFLGGSSAGFVNVAIHCLSRTTSAADGHTHQIDADLLPIPSPGVHGVTETVPVDANGYSDYRITSRPHDEGNVGAFQINHYANVWYLGQDAQGQVRGFRFNNTGGAGTESVKMAVWGFDKRTTKNS